MSREDLAGIAAQVAYVEFSPRRDVVETDPPRLARLDVDPPVFTQREQRPSTNPAPWPCSWPYPRSCLPDHQSFSGDQAQ